MENQEIVVVVLGIMVVLLCVVFAERGKSRKKVKIKAPSTHDVNKKRAELAKMKVGELKTLVAEGGTERVPTRKQDLIEIALKDWKG